MLEQPPPDQAILLQNPAPEASPAFCPNLSIFLPVLLYTNLCAPIT